MQNQGQMVKLTKRAQPFFASCLSVILVTTLMIPTYAWGYPATTEGQDVAPAAVETVQPPTPDASDEQAGLPGEANPEGNGEAPDTVTPPEVEGGDAGSVTPPETPPVAPSDATTPEQNAAPSEEQAEAPDQATAEGAWTATDALPTVGGTYYLTSDVMLPTSLTTGTYVTAGAIDLDLKGHTVTALSGKAYFLNPTSKASLTIRDSAGRGTITNAGTSSSSANLIQLSTGNTSTPDGASFTLESGTLENATGSAALYLGGSSKATISGGSLINSSGASALHINSAATASMSGGAINNSAQGKSVYVNDGGKFELLGGSIVQQSSSAPAIYVNTTGAFSMAAGSITSLGDAVEGTASSDIAITGGTIEAAGDAFYNGKFIIAPESNDVLTVTGGSLFSSTKPGTTVSGGTFTAKNSLINNTVTAKDLSLTGGVYNANPSDYVSQGYQAVESSGMFTVEKIKVFESGSGTAEDPYQIANVEQLKKFRDSVNTGEPYAGQFVKLTADIDLTNEAWAPIGSGSRASGATGSDAYYFEGNFDGNNGSIAGLNVIRNEDNKGAGLFGAVKNAVIQNVHVSSGTASNSVDAAAGVVAILLGDKCEVIKCSNSADVSGAAAAGVVSRAYAAINTITGCSNSGSISGAGKAGGIVCINNTSTSTTVDSCKNTGSVMNAGKAGAGGIFGYGNAGALITNCANEGSVGDVTSEYSGGIVGYATGDNASIEKCTNSGAVVAATCVGGSVGIITASWGVRQSTNSGLISGATNAGGIAGGNASGSLEECDNAACVTGEYAGGVAGSIGAGATISSCKGGSAEVTGTKASGRLVGSIGNGPAAENSCYLYIDDENGDAYEGIGTVGIMAPFTAWGWLTVSSGTLRGEPTVGGNSGVIVFPNDRAKWDGKSDVAGQWRRASADKPWVKTESYVAQVGDQGYKTLQAAMDAAVEGDTVTLLSDISLDSMLTLDKALTIDGANHTITAKDLNPAISIETNEQVSLTNLTLTGAKRGIVIEAAAAQVNLTGCVLSVSDRGVTFNADKNDGVKLVLNKTAINNSKVSDYDTQTVYAESRGISLWNTTNSTVTLENESAINGFAYCVNVAGTADTDSGVIDTSGLVVSVNNSTLRGYAGLNVWGSLATYNITGSTVKGINTSSGSSDNFAAIVFNDDITDQFASQHAENNILNITGSTITNYQSGSCIENLVRIDCGITKLNLSGAVAFTDTTGNIAAALYLGNMEDPFTFTQECVNVRDATVTCMTLDGAELAFMLSYGAFAQMTVGETTTVFNDPAKFITALTGAANETIAIKMLADMDVAGYIPVAEGQTVTLDTNGKKLTSSYSGSFIQNKGALTIAGDGVIYTTNTDAQGRHAVENYGTLTINSGTFGSKASRGNAVRNFGTATITGGSFTACDNYVNGGYAYALASGSKDYPDAKMTIENATVSGNMNGAVACDGGILTIKSGDLTLGDGSANNLYRIAYTSGTGVLNIEGGTFTKNVKNNYGFFGGDKGSSINVSGGTFADLVNETILVDSGSTTISGGTFKKGVAAGTDASLVVSGGTFAADPRAYLAEGCAVTEVSKTEYVVSHLYTLTYNLDGGSLSAGASNPSEYTCLSSAITLVNPQKTGYTFAGWTGTDITEATLKVMIPVNSTGDRSYNATWTANIDTAYKVEHYQQNVTGDDYVIMSADTENAKGITDTTATATPKTYDGFTHVVKEGQSVESGTISGDGALTLKVYYDRNSYDVTYAYTGTPPEGAANPPAKATYKYGSSVSVAEVPTLAGYTFLGWSKTGSFTMPAESIAIEGSWTANIDTAYKVERYQQNVTDDKYTLIATDDYTGATDTTATATPKTYDGFTHVEKEESVESGTISGDGALTLKVYYDRNSYDVTYKIDGSYFANASFSVQANVRYGSTLSLITNDMKQQGYTWSGWSALPETMPDAAVTVVGSYTVATDTVYKASYWFANVEGDDYSQDAAYPDKDMTGSTGAQSNVESTTVTGFTAKAVEQQAIAADGTTVVKVYYDRNSYDVTYSYTGTFPAGAATPPAKATYKYGSSVSVAEVPTLAGYTFLGWSKTGSFTMPAESVAIEGSWTVNIDTAYKVEHYQQNVSDDKYTPIATDDYTGATGTTATATPKTYDGFTHVVKEGQSVESGTISGDGTLTLKVYYDRNEYLVTWNAAGGTLEGSSEVRVRFGAEIVAPAVSWPEKHYFIDWSPTVPATVPADNVVFTAQWAEVIDPKTPNVVVSVPEVSDDPAASSATITPDAKLTAIETASDVMNSVMTGGLPAGITQQEADMIREVVGDSPAGDITVVTVIAAEQKTPDEVASDADLINKMLSGGQEASAYLDIKVSLIVHNEVTGNLVTTPLSVIDKPLAFEAHVPASSIAGKSVHIAFVHNGKVGFIEPESVDYATGIIQFPAGKFSTYAVVTSSAVEVAFEANGGTAVAPQLVDIGGKIVKPTNPEKAGFVFSGWYTDIQLTKAWNFDTDVVNQAITLFAKWTVEGAVGPDGKPGGNPGGDPGITPTTKANDRAAATTPAAKKLSATGDVLPGSLVGGVLLALVAVGMAFLAVAYRRLRRHER